MIVPCERNKYLIKLCKWHHNEDNTIIAIRKFISKWCVLEYEQVSDDTIYKFLLDVMEELFNKDELVKFIGRLFRFGNELKHTDAISDMISKIAMVNVLGNNGETLIDLDLNFEEVE